LNIPVVGFMESYQWVITPCLSPIDPNYQTLVLIDRADRVFLPNKFYAWSGPDQVVKIRWFDNVPPDHAVLGRVMYVTLPASKKFAKKKTGFLEADED